MKSSLPFWVLSVTAIALMATNLAVRREPPAGNSFDTIAEPNAEQSLSRSTSSSDAAAVLVEETWPKEEIVPKTTARTSAQPAFDWRIVETTDYKKYAANLRALGFPEELVQTIVIADINKLYEPRETALRPKVIPFDAPVSQRQTKVTQEDLDRMHQLREVQMEKQAAVKDILGIYVPRDTITTPTARNYVAYEYALNSMPPEKRDAVQIALENEWFADDVNKYLDRTSYVDVYKRTREERNAALTAILTPEEFERFEMNSNPAGTELARRTIGMEPTNEEFPEMFGIAWDHWVETGGVGGLWRAVPVPPEQIAAADAKMDVRMKEALGPERYLDYQMATSETGQQLRNLAARYDLPRETIVQTFQWQVEADQISKVLARPQQSANPGDPSQLKTRLAELQQQSEQILGPALWQAWMDGRKQRVKLEP